MKKKYLKLSSFHLQNGNNKENLLNKNKTRQLSEQDRASGTKFQLKINQQSLNEYLKIYDKLLFQYL